MNTEELATIEAMAQRNLPPVLACALLAFALAGSCRRTNQRRIALIPRTTGSAFWEAEHAGALAAARGHSSTIYWNAPQREDDVEGQIALVQKIAANHFDGLILAPDHSLALLTPVRRAIAKGVPVVIVSSGLQLPPSPALSYILSDDEKGGRMAAVRLAHILGGKGSVAVIGMDPDVIGIMQRLRSFERSLATEFPSVQLVETGPGAFNAAEAQQATIGILNRNPSLKAVVTLTTVSTRAVYSALKGDGRLPQVKLIGFEQDMEMLNAVRTGQVDSLVAENMYQMGFEAVRQMQSKWLGQTVPPRTALAPVLITRENVDSPQTRYLTRLDWFELN